MASRHVDVNERRLRPVYDALDSMNNKKAIQHADKILKKQKDLHCAKVLKSIALLRSGRREECEKLMEEVKKKEIADDSTLQAMTICFKEMERHSEISDIYEVAVKKSPQNEELSTHLFMSYVRTSQYKKQQQVAMNLYKKFQKNPYYFWAVMSCIMQASVCEDEHVKKNMLLPLAEKMILKFIKDKKVESHEEVYVYLLVLEMQEKYEGALEVINGPLGEFLFPNVKAKKKVDYLLKLERWREVNLLYKNLIEENPDEWSSYQGYLESMIKLVETNYSDTDGNNSCDVPDHSVSMVREFLEKMKNKELEKETKRNRGPFLACLELRKRQNEENILKSSAEPPGDLKALIVEYFQFFGDKSVCFSDLCVYIDLLDPTQKLEFLESCRASLSSSCGNISEDVKALSRTITIEKFSRYLGERENFSTEEKIAHARHLMSMHKDGEKFGENLLPTDFHPCDELALLAAHHLLDCCNIPDDHSNCWLRVVITLESAIRNSPSNFQFKLLVSRLYCQLGAVGPCVTYLNSMDVKHILYDTLGLNVSRYEAPLGHFKSAKEFYNSTFKFYQGNKKDTPEYVIASYKFGSFEKIIEIMNFKKKLENSFFYPSVLIEQKLLDAVLLANSATSIREIFVDQKLPEVFDNSETWINKLRDNRDLDLFVTWRRCDRVCRKEARKISFRCELLWIKLRLLIINAATLVTNGSPNNGVTSSAMMNGENSPCNEMINHTDNNSDRTRNILDQLQDILTEARVCEPAARKFPFYGPLTTRWKAYLDGSYEEVLIGLLNIAQVLQQMKKTHGPDDKLEERVAAIKKDLTRISTILEDNATLCSNSLTYEDKERRIFNGNVVHLLVLFVEAITIVLVFLSYIRTVVLKVTQISQNKKKKKVLPPAETELSESYQAFTQSLSSAISGVNDNLLDDQVLHLAQDLTSLDLDKLNKMTDSSELLAEICEKMQTSYKISVEEISDVLKIKLKFLKTLCI
ncbi:N-alpha-acetyltransferase 25, NatB auxiliary subunit-like [Dendronephthya gigantea]|uniref:N-alpha-acetyltransferase 25, NatB auxiliary subunit-like n=1 Tax=Dendronephthya gigantea TaxID=151771 RepID=UPI0010690A7A|nr:N-alpha-acetyltransferase 25, NatB auxiliary subunit-like [Dendronephthya gigantea]